MISNKKNDCLCNKTMQFYKDCSPIFFVYQENQCI